MTSFTEPFTKAVTDSAKTQMEMNVQPAEHAATQTTVPTKSPDGMPSMSLATSVSSGITLY